MATIYQTELAKYNDLVDDKKSDDLEFYAELADSVEGPILDLGCGTGRVAIDLARRGFNIIGVDLSWDNLHIAQQHLCLETRAVQDHVQLINSDIRYFSTTTKAKLIILAYNVFNELIETVAQIDALRSIHDNLSPGGILTLEIHPEFSPLPFMWLDQIVSLKDDTQVIQYIQHSPIFEDDTFLSHFIFEHINAEGVLVKKLIGTLKRRIVPANQMEQLLNSSGFIVDAVYTSYHQNVDFMGDHLLFVAHRKTN